MLYKSYAPKEVEEKIYRFWEKTGFFNPDKLPAKKKAKTFVAPIAPPNVTGSLHMGHALENTLVDLLVRKARLEGKKALFIPGTDHAGIATQNVVEKELKKEGKTRFDLGREEFIKRVWQWKEKYGHIILEQLKKLGASCDWSRTRFTMDKDYALAVKKAFEHYYKKGWIYQAQRVVNWCKRCQTSLSELELEHEEIKGKLYYIRYPLKLNSKFKIQNSKFIAVATTRPETMLGDTAVAVNPKDKRYKNLIGKRAILPLINRELPIVADEAVDPAFGSGAVKVTPAHDILDWEIAQRRKLPLIQVIDEKGKMTKDSQICQGLSPQECREKVLQALQSQGSLEKTEDYVYSVPRCYRCHTLIEPLNSKQWFLKMTELAKTAREAAQKKEVEIIPRRYKKIYLDWLKKERDWCISRQIWWGHNLPIWRCQIGNKAKGKSQKAKVDEKEYYISLIKPKKCHICAECKPEQVPDVLDTWFSSALWPFATLGWPIACGQSQKSKACKPIKGMDLEKFYPNTLVSSARDILHLWITRMIFSGKEFMGRAPFKKVYIHSTILTKEGKRMSKSLGTGIDPLELIEKYGADAVRFGLIWQERGTQDIRFDESHIQMGRKFCNKIWNAARFVLTQISKSKVKRQKAKLQLKIQNLSKADKTILQSLNKTIKTVNKDIEGFRFGQGAEKLYSFFWKDFCDRYLEESKKQLMTDNPKLKAQTVNILLYVLLKSLILLHPFMPFITEELYQKLPLKNKEKSIMVEEWPGS